MSYIREAFAKQISGCAPITEAYFDIKDEDRYKPHQLIEGMLPWTDETWEKYKERRLTTDFGTKKQVGDRILYAIFVEPSPPGVAEQYCSRLRTVVEREFDMIAARFHVISDETVLPTLIEKGTLTEKD